MNDTPTFIFIPIRPPYMERDTKLKLLRRLLHVMVHYDEPMDDRAHLVWGIENLITDIELEAH